MQSKLKNNLFLFLFCIASAISISLLVMNIDQYPFWDDESSVSWFAGNYNKFGKIIGYDGHNGFFYRNGALLNSSLEYNNPPLDIYYISLIQKYIGSGDIIERGAFIFLAILFLIVFYAFITLYIGKNIWSLFSYSLFALSISFILYSKNCRYYSIELLLAMLLVFVNYYIQRYSDHKRLYLLLILHFLFSILIYLGHYTQGLAWIISSIAFNFFISQSTLTYWIKNNKWFIITNCLVFLYIAIHIWLNKVWVRPDLSEDDFILYKLFLLFVWLIHDLNRYLIFPIWMILFVLYRLYIKKDHGFFNHQSQQIIKLILVFFSVSILISPQNTKMSGSFDIRYVYSVFPFIGIILGYLLNKIYENSRPLGIGVFFLFLLTSAPYYIPFSTPFQIPLLNYIKEKNDPHYTSASFEILNYLDTVKPNQTLSIYPQYFHTQVLDYYSQKFELTNTLDGNSQLYNAPIVDSLNLSFAKDTNIEPNILIIVGKNAPKQKDLKLSNYKYTDTIDVYGSFDIEIFRPELPWHYFETIKNFDRKKDAIYIFRK